MPKYYCDYCDVFLTHDSASVRKAHNAGRNHLQNVRDYYASLGHDKAQDIIDQIISAHANGPPMGSAPPMRLGPGFMNPSSIPSPYPSGPPQGMYGAPPQSSPFPPQQGGFRPAGAPSPYGQGPPPGMNFPPPAHAGMYGGQQPPRPNFPPQGQQPNGYPPFPPPQQQGNQPFRPPPPFVPAGGGMPGPGMGMGGMNGGGGPPPPSSAPGPVINPERQRLLGLK